MLYRYSHIGLIEKGIELCNDIFEYPLTIFPVTEVDIHIAIELIEEHKGAHVKPRDAIHAATLKNNKIENLISADKDFDNFDFITRIDPKDYTPKNK